MNKKVLTLCAGFMLAGSMGSVFAQTFAEETKDDAHKDKYYHVFVNVGTDAGLGNGILAEKQEDGQFVVSQSGNMNKKEFMWTITKEAAKNGQPERYYLINAQSGKSLSVKVGDVTYDGFINPYNETWDNELWFTGEVEQGDGTAWNGFIGKDNEITNNSSNVWHYLLQEVESETVSDELNDLYNSTGFNLVLNQDKWKDVANIFDDQRVKAIKVPSGVTSPVTSETDYAFPEGTYFVVSTPAEVQPNGGNDLYNWLQQCTFIAVASTENDINDKADREAGKGFMLTTVSGRDLVKYQGTDKSKRAHGSRIAVNNACFTVYKNLDNQYAILVDELWYNKNKVADIKDTDEQAKADTALSLNVTEKVGEDNDDLYLTTDSNDKKFIFAMEEVFTQKALDWLKTDGMAAYNIQFVSGDAENMYLYCTAYDNKAYAKGINFIDIDTPEAQFVITDVNEDDNSLTFTNRANRNQSITVKLYEEADDVYSIAVDKDDQANDNFYVVSVDQNGNLVTASESLDIHGQWAKITPATVDQFAGTWDVDNLTEVTMSFARDENSTSNRLFVHAEANDANQLQTLKVSNTLTDAVQFQLRKSSKPTYLKNIYAYKIGDKVNYRSEGDTVAYYTYQLQAYRDGHAIERYLKWNGTDGAYELADAGDWFIIKDNKDGSVSILTTSDYDHKDFIAVEDYNWTSGTTVPSIENFEGNSIKYGQLNEAVDAVDVKTYLNVESPETSLDPKSTYVTLVTEDDDYVAIKDNRDGIISGEETTLRLFVTDTDRQIPSFLVSNGWNEENGERMFLFNSVDSVNYNVATGEFDKEYALQGNHNLNKAIFRPGKLSETNTANDTLFTTIKGKETAVTNVASNTENAQAGLNRYKFQIVADEENEGYYIVRQEGYYLFNVNSKLVFANSDQFNRTNALRVKVTNVESPTANETINAANNSVVVAGVDGAVVVKGAEGKNVIVSTILGKVVANEVVSSDNATIAAPAGIVVVSVDGESFKVVVK